jgi:selenocysteine lyase/cysteine desulfurase
MEACKQLEKWGIEVTYVPVEENGIVDPQKIKAALKPTRFLLLSCSPIMKSALFNPFEKFQELFKSIEKRERGTGRKGIFEAIPYQITFSASY